jgi:DNA-binding transcriptional ArsR family regulator
MANGNLGIRSPKAKPSVTRGRTVSDVSQHLRKVQRATILLKQAGEPTRLQIIMALYDGEKHVGAISDELNQTQPAVSHHLALLRHSGLIAPRRQGKNNFYSLTDTGLELARAIQSVVA